MPKASELKRGMVIEIDQMPFLIKQMESRSPSSRGAATLYKVRMNNLKTGQKRDETFKGDDFLQEGDCTRKVVQYSYREENRFVFMDLEDFNQYDLDERHLETQTGYLLEGLEGITAILHNDQILGIELPQSVILSIIETTPSVKGATATGRTKPAQLSTGLEVQVPEYLEAGEQIKVSTATGKFISRA